MRCLDLADLIALHIPENKGVAHTQCLAVHLVDALPLIVLDEEVVTERCQFSTIRYRLPRDWDCSPGIGVMSATGAGGSLAPPSRLFLNMRIAPFRPDRPVDGMSDALRRD